MTSPKWAQNKIEEILVQGEHLWPQFEEPNPIEHDDLTQGYIFTHTEYPSILDVDVKGTSYKRSGQIKDWWMKLEHKEVYATKLDALKAHRWFIARKYAGHLRTCDRKIEEETDKIEQKEKEIKNSQNF